jgi:hypothetical protein
MQYFLLVTFILSLVSFHASAATVTPLACTSASGIHTQAEIELVASEKIYNVNVNFIGKRPSNKEIDRVLRDCVSAAIKLDGTKDILGSPWLRKSAKDNPRDDELLQPYPGLKYLSYEASSKSISVRELKIK